MSVIFISLLASTLQLVLLLCTSRVLGSVEYGRFSFVFVIAIFVASVVGEWARMILARYAGTSRLRVKRSILIAVRKWVDWTAVICLSMTSIIALVLWRIHALSNIGEISAIGVCVASSGYGDAISTYLRFNCTRTVYNIFALVRVCVSGIISLTSAILWHSAYPSVILFALATLMVASVFRVLFWGGDGRKVQVKFLFKWAWVGWSMASSSISTNLAFTISRAGLRQALGSAALGQVFLALDLTTRGVTVLGGAINSWAARLVFDKAHRDGGSGVREVFPRVSKIFLSIWAAAAAWGACMAVILPLVVWHSARGGLYFAATGANVIAIIFLTVKIYCIDVYLNAVNRSRELMISSVILSTVVLIIFSAGGIYYRIVAAFALPIAATIAAIFYIYRNPDLMRSAIRISDFTYLFVKTGVLAILIGMVGLKLYFWASVIGFIGLCGDFFFLRRLWVDERAFLKLSWFGRPRPF